MSNLENQFSEYNSEVSKELPSYSGLLGLSIGGSRTVNISTRAGFVYVRLRDNLNEVVQAYNDKVSPVYDLPVLIQRVGNRWHVIGKDTSRYDVWGTSAPFLPAHAGQHEFNRAIGSGGDAVFVYDDQFMPLLVYPSGTSGAGMLMVAPYVLQRNADFIYVGNTGTGNLLIYKPTDNQAIMGLVVLNKTTGNPEVLIASGTPFSGVVTGTHQVIPYLAYPASHQEPLYGFRLVSGTTALRWENLYNVRQFIGGNQSTGTSSSLPSFITGSVPFAGADGNLTENNPYLRWKNSNHQLFIGKPEADQFDFDDTYPLVLTSNSVNNAIAMSVVTYGTGTSGGPSPSYVAWRSRGTFEARTPVQKDDALLTLSALGWDGTGWANQSRIRFYANQNWITGSVLPTRMDFDITPSGSATRRTQFQIYGDSVNIPTGSTYNVGGTPHTHTDLTPTTGWVPVTDTWTYASASTITIPSDGTTKYQKGMKIRLKQGGGYKYYIVASVTSTLITVFITTTTVANSAITDIAYSFTESPYGWPGYLDFNIDYTGFSVKPTTSYARCWARGDRAYIRYKQVAASLGTSNATTFTLTGFPVAIAAADVLLPTFGIGVDNSAALVTPCRMDLSGTTLTLYKDAAGAAWTNSGSKGIYNIELDYQF